MLGAIDYVDARDTSCLSSAVLHPLHGGIWQRRALSPLAEETVSQFLDAGIEAETEVENKVRVNIHGSSLSFQLAENSDQVHVSLTSCLVSRARDPRILIINYRSPLLDSASSMMNRSSFQVAWSSRIYSCRACQSHNLRGFRCDLASTPPEDESLSTLHSFCPACSAQGVPTDTWLIIIGGDEAALQAALADLARAGAIRTDLTTSFQVEKTEHAHGSFASVHRVSPKGSAGDLPQYPKEGLVAKFFHPPSAEKMINKPYQIMNEVSMLSMVQGHPNIVGMHGLFCCSSENIDWPNFSRYAMIMDFCGGDLWGFINKSPSMSEWRAAQILRGVLSALELVHSRGMVHRDVKVENILMASNERPILADFGLAVLKTDHEEMRRRVGSPGYAAPEVLDSDCLDYDEKVDIFAVGVVLYFMFCRRTPFDGADLATILRKTVRCKLNFEDTKEIHVLSNSCKRCLRCLLAKSPADRPHAGEVLASSSFQHMCILRTLSPREVIDADSTCTTPASIATNSNMNEATEQNRFDRISVIDGVMSDSSVRDHPPSNRRKRFVRRAWSVSTAERASPALASMVGDITTERFLIDMSRVKPPSRDQASYRRHIPSPRSLRSGRCSPQVSDGSNSSLQNSEHDLLAELCKEPSAEIDVPPCAGIIDGNKFDPKRPHAPPPRAPFTRFRHLRASSRHTRAL